MGQSYVVGDTGQNFVLFSDRVTSRQGVPKWQFSLLDGMVVPLYDHEGHRTVIEVVHRRPF